MAAAATMAAAARELVLRAGASDVEEEEGPLVRTPAVSPGFCPVVLASERPGLGFCKSGSLAATGGAVHTPPWGQNGGDSASQDTISVHLQIMRHHRKAVQCEC